ncbi:kinase-like domain-containing protein [Rhizophagus irregularis DAOM 181602=DAOM 197198]|nr:kinase-like domain-containing protein [Rhizophagus irregularis DAOM 181602=DAOM 197198]
MEQPINHKHKIDILLSNNTVLIQPAKTSSVKSKYKKKKCNECNKRRKPLDESHQICHVCYKIKKATWIDGPVINYSNTRNIRQENYTVVLKKLNNSNNITSKELNELKIFYELFSNFKCTNRNNYVAKYFGITQDPNSQDIMIIMPYYDSV